jgi:hypothetical protein
MSYNSKNKVKTVSPAELRCVEVGQTYKNEFGSTVFGVGKLTVVL